MITLDPNPGSERCIKLYTQCNELSTICFEYYSNRLNFGRGYDVSYDTTGYLDPLDDIVADLSSAT